VRDAGDYFESLTNNNLNNKPSLDAGVNWQKAIVSIGDVTDNSGKVFATVADMVEDKTLAIGNAARTLEKTTGNGQSELFEVNAVSGTPDGIDKILLDNGLHADRQVDSAKLFSAQFLQTTSDIINGSPIPLFRFIPVKEHAAIQAFTSTTDIASNFQNALDSGATRLIMTFGNYIVGTQLNFDAAAVRTAGMKIIGDGIKRTIFDNRVASGFMIDFNQDSASKFHLGSELSGFSIEQTTAPASSSGIRIRAAFFTDIRDIAIDNLTGNGIEILNSTSLDTDQNVHFSITGSEIRNCDLVAVNFNYATNAAAGYRIERNRFLDNAGALRLATAHARVINNGFSQSVTNPQVVLAHNGLANNYDFVLAGNFFEKGRAGELEIEGCIGGRIEDNTFTSNDSSSGPFAIKFGFDQAVRSMIIERNRHIIEASISAAYTIYDIGPLATNNKIDRPEYSDIQSATKIGTSSTAGTHTGANNAATLTDSTANFPVNALTGLTINNVTDGSSATVISNTAMTVTATLTGGTDDDWDTSDSYSFEAGDNGNVITTTPGEYLHTDRLKRNRITTAATTVAPDLLLGSWNHFFFTSTGAITINKPINGNNDGAEMILSVRNSSGGSITVTFGTGITVQNYADPANGVHTHARFCFDLDSATWRQIGAWSLNP